MTIPRCWPTAFNHNQWVLYLPSPIIPPGLRSRDFDLALSLRHKCKSGLLGSTWSWHQGDVFSQAEQAKRAAEMGHTDRDLKVSYISCQNCYSVPTDEEMSVLTATWALWNRA